MKMSFSAQGMVKVFNKYLPISAYGVEIGVDKGESTKGLMKNCPKIIKLIGVDPWEPYPAIDEQTVEKNHAIAMVYLKDLINANRVVIARKKSLELAKDALDSWYDFVYIDGDHSYESTYADICAWFPKVKKGGIVSGHDFRPDKDWEVKAAINKFATENGYEVNVEPNGWSWWFIK